MLQGATKLNKNEMKSVKGGVPASEYCDTLKEIMINKDSVTSGECVGANYGAERAGCSFRFICD